MNNGRAKMIRDQAARRMAVFEEARGWRQQGVDLQNKGEVVHGHYGPLVPKRRPVSVEGTVSRIPDELKPSQRER